MEPAALQVVHLTLHIVSACGLSPGMAIAQLLQVLASGNCPN